MDSINTIVALGAQLKALQATPDTVRAQLLSAWLKKGGLTSHQTNLITFLTNASRSTAPEVTLPSVSSTNPVDVIYTLGQQLTTLTKGSAPRQALALIGWLKQGALQGYSNNLIVWLDAMNPEVTAPPDVDCKAFVLDGWERGELLGAGGYGDVYKSSNNTVIKEALAPKNLPKGYIREGKAATIAGNLGVGPVVYRHGICPHKHAPTKVYEYIVSQRLSGPLLAETYPYKSEQVVEALNLYYTLLKKTGIMHNDPNGNNFVYDNGRMYLVDYGSAQFAPALTAEEQVAHMRQIIPTLVTGFLYAKDNKGERPWVNDRVHATRMANELYDIANTWFKTTFPNETQPIVF